MPTLVVPARLLKAFADEGLVPDHCSDLEIGINASKGMQLTYTVYLRQEHLAPLSRVFAKLDEQMKQEQAAMTSSNGAGRP